MNIFDAERVSDAVMATPEFQSRAAAGESLAVLRGLADAMALAAIAEPDA